jgi:hypothetical protein
VYIPDPPPPVFLAIAPPTPEVPSPPPAWGSNLRFVTCHRCGHRFCYRMVRAAWDTASDVRFMMGAAGGFDRASPDGGWRAASTHPGLKRESA